MRKKMKLIFVIFFLTVTFQISAQDKEGDLINKDFLLDLVAGLLKLDRIDEAVDVLNKLSASFPENYDIRLYRGIALCMKKDYESAFYEFQKIDNSLDLQKRTRGHIRPLRADDMALAAVSLQKERFTFSPKNTGLLYFGRGVTLIILKEDYKTAAGKLTSAIKKGYDEANVRYLLIHLYLKLKDYKKADEELKRLSERKGMDEVDYFIKGYLHYQRGLEKDAISFFKKAIEINSNLMEAKKNLACIYYNKGEWEKAAEIWKSVLEMAPEDIESKLNIARAYFYLGRLDEAKKQFETLNISIPIEKYSPKKIPLIFIPLENWIKFNVRYQIDYEALLKYGVDIEKLRKMGVKPSMVSATLNERALLILRTEGKIEEAIKILELATQIDRTSFFINYNLGQLYFNSGKLEKAKEYALKAIQNKKNFLEAHDLLGNVYFKEGKYNDALEEFKRVVEISESDAQGHYNLGCAYWALNELEKAEEEWRKAIIFDKQRLSKEKEEKFIEDGLSISMIVRKVPVSYRAHISLASLYERKDLIEDTIKEYEKAVETEPNNPEAYFELGRVHIPMNLATDSD
ncbi:MAG: tetratricopeptide repeat protein [Acidobacteriota bacterium]